MRASQERLTQLPWASRVGIYVNAICPHGKQSIAVRKTRTKRLNFSSDAQASFPTHSRTHFANGIYSTPTVPSTMH